VSGVRLNKQTDHNDRVALELVTSRYPKFLGYFLSVFNDSIAELNICMSWFKRIPHRYPPTTPAPAPYRSSPATDRALEQAKEIGPRSHKNVKKSRPINKG
jgi:hypothetical protein